MVSELMVKMIEGRVLVVSNLLNGVAFKKVYIIKTICVLSRVGDLVFHVSVDWASDVCAA